MSDELTPDERAKLDLWTPMQPPSDFADRVLAARDAVPVKPRSYRWVAALSAATVAAVAVFALFALRQSEQATEMAKATSPEPTNLEQRREQNAAVARVAPTVTTTPTVTPAQPTTASPPDTIGQYDLAVIAGETFTIHTPVKETVQLRVSMPVACKSGIRVTVDSDRLYLAQVASEGSTFAIVPVSSGSWVLKTSCRDGWYAMESRVSVVVDPASRKLRPFPSPTINADGRDYRIKYVGEIPDIIVDAKDRHAKAVLHVTGGAVPGFIDTTFNAKDGKVVIPGKEISLGAYTYYFERDGVKDGVESTFRPEFDNAAPNLFLDTRRSGGGQLVARGEVAAGYTLAISGVQVSIDNGRFQATATDDAWLRLDHPHGGTHYYLFADAVRRPSAAPVTGTLNVEVHVGRTPVAGAVVTLVPGGSTSYTDAAGRVKVNVVAGDYTIEVNSVNGDVWAYQASLKVRVAPNSDKSYVIELANNGLTD